MIRNMFSTKTIRPLILPAAEYLIRNKITFLMTTVIFALFKVLRIFLAHMLAFFGYSDLSLYLYFFGNIVPFILIFFIILVYYDFFYSLSIKFISWLYFKELSSETCFLIKPSKFNLIKTSIYYFRLIIWLCVDLYIATWHQGWLSKKYTGSELYGATFLFIFLRVWAIMLVVYLDWPIFLFFLSLSIFIAHFLFASLSEDLHPSMVENFNKFIKTERTLFFVSFKPLLIEKYKNQVSCYDQSILNALSNFLEKKLMNLPQSQSSKNKDYFIPAAFHLAYYGPSILLVSSLYNRPLNKIFSSTPGYTVLHRSFKSSPLLRGQLDPLLRGVVKVTSKIGEMPTHKLVIVGGTTIAMGYFLADATYNKYQTRILDHQIQNQQEKMHEAFVKDPKPFQEKLNLEHTLNQSAIQKSLALREEYKAKESLFKAEENLLKTKESLLKVQSDADREMIRRIDKEAELIKLKEKQNVNSISKK